MQKREQFVNTVGNKTIDPSDKITSTLDVLTKNVLLG